MPKIEEITYQTHPSEFIDYVAIAEQLNSLKIGFTNIENCIISTLNTEINEGGLDLYSVNINGVPIYHNKAVEIYQELSSISTECNKIISEIDAIAKEHRQQEIDKLIEKLKEEILKKNNRIAELNRLIDSADNQNDKIKYQNEKESLQDDLDGGWWCNDKGGLNQDLKDAEKLQ